MTDPTKERSPRRAGPGNGTVAPPVPDHEMIRRIGGGSYGEVWLARSVIGSYRAVKIVYRDSFDNERPFLREFNGIQKFEPISRSHESQVDILQVGKREGYFYYVMELADDASLDEGVVLAAPGVVPQPVSIEPASSGNLDPATYIPKTLGRELYRRGKLSVEECLRVSLSLTTALENLHRHGLVHRDIKPSNIIFVNGIPKLADIGLVTSIDATVSHVGTEGFLPPEGAGTPQGDVYSLGKVLYEMCTGRDRQDFPELPSNLAEMPERQGLLELNAIISKACQQDPSNRYQSATEMYADIVLLLSGKSLRRVRSLERRVKVLTRSGAVLIAVMVLGVVPYYIAIKEAARARLAEANADEQLWNSRLAQVQSGRWSHRAGRRFDGLEILRKAAVFRSTVELRNEAIACLALPDLRRPGHSNSLWGTPDIAAFDCNCERCAWPDPKGNISVRRVVDQKEIAFLPGSGKTVHELYFSPDGRFLAASYYGPKLPLQIWDLQAQKIVFGNVVAALRDMDFSSDSSLAAIAQQDGSILIFDLRTGQELRTINMGFLPFQVALQPRGGKLAVSSNQRTNVLILDVQTGETLQSLPHPGGTLGLAWCPGSNLLAVGCADHRIYLWDVAASQTRAILTGHQAPATQIRFSHGGNLLASRGWDGYLRLWDAITGDELCGLAVLGCKPTFTSDDHWLGYAATNLKPSLLEVASGLECRMIRFDEKTRTGSTALAFSPDGKVLASVHPDGVRLWNSRTGALIGFEPIGDTRTVIFHPSQPTLITGGADGLKVWPIDLSVERPATRSRLGAAEMIGADLKPDRGGVGLDREGRIAAVASEDRVRLFDLAAKVAKSVVGAERPFGLVSLSANGRWCAASEIGTNVVCVFDLAGGKALCTLTANLVSAVTFSADNRWLAVAGIEEYTFWNAGKWQPSCTLRREGASATHGVVAFSADSRMAAIAHSAQLIRLVDPGTGREFATLEAPKLQNLAFFAFSPDGSQLAASTFEQEIQLWDLRLIRSELATMKLDWDVPP